MSLPHFTSDQFITVFMSTRINETRLIDDPPLLRTAVSDPIRRQDVEDSVVRVARLWDIYRDVVQLSFYHEGHAYHFMLCDDPKWDARGHIHEQDNRTIRLYDDEEDLVRDAFTFIREVFGPETPEGQPMYMRTLVGWRMYIELWPFLVNRALKYRIPIYRDMLTNPDTKWPTTKHLSDIATLYLQGGGGIRKLPGLADLLRFWGYWQDEHRPMPEDIEAAVCEDPFGTAGYIEQYLRDMHSVMCLYYSAQSTTNAQPDSPLTGLAVPETGAQPWPK